MIRLKEDTDLIDRAVEAAVAAGLCVVPTRREGKAPVAEWKEFQTDRPSPRQLNKWYGYGRTGIGIVCGAVSDRLEALDFDDEAVYIDYFARARAAGLGDLVDRIEGGYLERTPSGGRHWLMRVPEVGGNTKLACRPKTEAGIKHPRDKVKTLIETRGEGGYLVIAPTHGRVHETHRPYVLISGDFNGIETISEPEREQLHTLARTFDTMPRKQHNGRGGPRKVSGPYNERTTWPELLEPAGWVTCSENGGTISWTRPGKDSGVSATTNYGGGRPPLRLQ